MSEARLRELVASVLGRGKVPAAGDFSLRDAGLDSLGMIDLVTGMESAFGIQVAPEDITPENFASFASLAAFVDARRARVE